MAKELPRATVKRILKANLAGKKIGNKAVEHCIDYIEEVIADIGFELNRLADHENRNIIREKDMLFVLESE